MIASITTPGLGEAVRRVHGGEVEGAGVDAEAALRHLRLDPVADAGDGALGGAGHRVRDQYPPARDGGHLGDPRAHRAGADDANRYSAGSGQLIRS